MIITGDLAPNHADRKLLASIDVEWSKNFRIRNGSVPFCFSIAWLLLPDTPVDLTEVTWTYSSWYVEGADETQDLIAAADTAFGEVLDTATLVVGHQFSSDLGTLINAAHHLVPNLHAVRENWRRRRAVPAVPMLDTRYDLDRLLAGTSRRLVDVCTELHLDVTQPELGSTSMTALHRRWLEGGDAEARERITVLNLRHSLSTALVALLGEKHPVPTGEVNVNRLLANRLTGTYAWTSTPAFTALLQERPA
ncbi:hypothetical protein ACFY19_11130 [Streptosporangium saharense]|uniref:hypothetical protein n=1 Tax=Streptosporangium saharense TaxID=1706840 RepID=UPI0036C91EBA